MYVEVNFSIGGGENTPELDDGNTEHAHSGDSDKAALRVAAFRKMLYLLDM